jgi:hypothetical protein
MFNGVFFENLSLYEIKGKCFKNGQATHVNMVHVHCMLDTYVYKHTYVMLIAFFTENIGARTHLKFTLYVLCLSCSGFAYRVYLMRREDSESCACVSVKLRVGLPLPERSKETKYIKNQTTKCVNLVATSDVKNVAHTMIYTTA